MKIIASNMVKSLGTNIKFRLSNEFQLYDIPDFVFEFICKQHNTALAYIEYVINITPEYEEFVDLTHDKNYLHLKSLMTFMRENLKKGLHINLKRE